MAVTDLVLPPVNRPFVEALAEIAPTQGRWAVIGGFAVWAHLGETHRPTLDVDDLDDQQRLFIAGHWAAVNATTDRGADKRGSDGLDIVRLLETANFDALADDADIVPGLRLAVMWGVEKVLVEQAARVGRMIQLHTETPNVDTKTTEALGLRLLETLAGRPR